MRIHISGMLVCCNLQMRENQSRSPSQNPDYTFVAHRIVLLKIGEAT